MTSDYNDHTEGRSYILSTDMSPAVYDNSSESSASSPLIGYSHNFYGGNSYIPHPGYPMQIPTVAESQVPPGLIPVELDIEGLFEERDRRRTRNGSEKTVASHIHSRRRAQNRASQRAFRDRKEKHMRDLEQQLGELESRHNDLSQSYESLQAEYSNVKVELERLRKDSNVKSDCSPENTSRDYGSDSQQDWEQSRAEIVEPLFFDVSAFCYDHGESGYRKD